MVLETPRGHAVLSVAEGKAMVPLAAARNLDPEIVLAQGDGDWTLLREVVDIFREDAPRMLSEIRRCLVAKDGPGLERSAHALKGCVANLGARDAVEAALALELMGRDGTVAGAEARLDDLEREVDSMERLLVRMCEEAPA